jgi:hypothetical protein
VKGYVAHEDNVFRGGMIYMCLSVYGMEAGALPDMGRLRVLWLSSIPWVVTIFAYPSARHVRHRLSRALPRIVTFFPPLYYMGGTQVLTHVRVRSLLLRVVSQVAEFFLS